MLSLSKTKPLATKQLISPILASICLALMLLLHWLCPVGLLLRFPFNLAGLLVGGLGLTICFVAHRLRRTTAFGVFEARYVTYQARTPRWI